MRKFAMISFVLQASLKWKHFFMIIVIISKRFCIFNNIQKFSELKHLSS